MDSQGKLITIVVVLGLSSAFQGVFFSMTFPYSRAYYLQDYVYDVTEYINLHPVSAPLVAREGLTHPIMNVSS